VPLPGGQQRRRGARGAGSDHCDLVFLGAGGSHRRLLGVRCGYEDDCDGTGRSDLGDGVM
jgi:hypothetical protein